MRISNFKPLIAILSLPVLSFTAGQCLPYVIAAISGAIAAVPLAIFAVSTVVVLISAVYLIKQVKQAVSVIVNKKKADLSGKELGRTASQELVCENCANLESNPIGKKFDEPVKRDSESQTEMEGKSSVPTPAQSPVTLGTAIPQELGAVPPPPPPPEGVKSWNSSKNSTTGKKSLASTTQKSTSSTKSTPEEDSKKIPFSLNNNDIEEMRKKLKRPVPSNNSIGEQQGGGGSIDNSREVPQNQRDAMLKQIRKGVKLKHVKRDTQQNQPGTVDPLINALNKVRKDVAPSDSENNSGYGSDDWETDPDHMNEPTLPITKEDRRKAISFARSTSSSAAQVSNAGQVNSKTQSLPSPKINVNSVDSETKKAFSFWRTQDNSYST